jgi:hypothetical protein
MNYSQIIFGICVSEKNYKRYTYLFAISFIIGLIMSVYGSCTLPNEIPGQSQTHISTSNSDINQESQQYQTDLRNYQIQSKEFKIIMIGIGCVIISFLFGYISHIKYNIHSELEETRQNRKSILKVKRSNESRILPLVNSKIVESDTVNTQESLNSKTEIVVKDAIIDQQTNNSPPIMLKATSNNRTIPRLYYQSMPLSYQEYYKKNGYPLPIQKN